jgi:hypothetical protein
MDRSNRHYSGGYRHQCIHISADSVSLFSNASKRGPYLDWKYCWRRQYRPRREILLQFAGERLDAQLLLGEQRRQQLRHRVPTSSPPREKIIHGAQIRGSVPQIFKNCVDFRLRQFASRRKSDLDRNQCCCRSAAPENDDPLVMAFCFIDQSRKIGFGFSEGLLAHETMMIFPARNDNRVLQRCMFDA